MFNQRISEMFESFLSRVFYFILREDGKTCRKWNSIKIPNDTKSIYAVFYRVDVVGMIIELFNRFYSLYFVCLFCSDGASSHNLALFR